MSIFKPTFVPIQEARSERVQTQLSLPSWLPTDEIGADIDAMEGICKLAGISQLTITTTNESVSEVFTNNGSVNSDGTMSGSPSITISKLVEHKRTLHGFSDYKPAQESSIALNIPHQDLYQKVSERGDPQSPENWAKEINYKIKKTLLLGGLAHLLTPATISFLIQLIAVTGFATYDILFELALNTSPYPLPFNLTVANFALAGADLDGGRRPSLVQIGGIEFDRAAILTLILSTRTLVKRIEPPKSE